MTPTLAIEVPEREWAPLLCPRCQGEVTVVLLGRLGKYVGHHQPHRYRNRFQPCQFDMGTWGSVATISELEKAVATLPPRQASPENLENVAAVVSSLIGRHSTTARLKKEVLGLMRRLEDLEGATR